MEHNFASPFSAQSSGITPTIAQCRNLWDKYHMLANIKMHSLLVAEIAFTIASLAIKKDLGISYNIVLAAALLHDLGKTYTVNYGGNHSQIGASWSMEETGNPAIAQCILHHVYWPGKLDVINHFEPLVIIYADKRVKHDMITPLDLRFADILERYGTNTNRRDRIKKSYEQNQFIEQELNKLLEVDLNAYPLNRRRLVQ